MTLPGLTLKERRKVVALMNELAHQDGLYKTVDDYLIRYGFDYDDWRQITDLAMPAIQQAQLFKRNLAHYKLMKRELLGLIRIAEKMEPNPDTERLTNEMRALFARHNHGYEGMTDEEAGVIEDV